MAQSTEELDFDKDLCLYTLTKGFEELSVVLIDIPLVLIQIIIDYCAIYEPEDGGTPWPYFLDTTFNEEIMKVLKNTTRRVCIYTDYDRIMINIVLLRNCKRMQSLTEIKEHFSCCCCFFKEGINAVGSRIRLGVAEEKFKWMQKEKNNITIHTITSDPKEAVYHGFRPFDLVLVDGHDFNPNSISISDKTTKIIDEARKLIVILPLSYKTINRSAEEDLLMVRLDPIQGVTTQYIVAEPKPQPKKVVKTVFI